MISSPKNIILPLAMLAASQAAGATEPTDSIPDVEVDEVVVSVRQPGQRKLLSTVENATLISGAELRRAACCNLGESFTTNPSVDVSYADAATGAKQIKLLGLSGTYVQMMTENIPNFRGAAAPYGLGYLAGPWIQSIQVSKGASSVKNGYESITGQINIEMLKPQTDQSVAVNAYADHMGRLEANAAGNIHLSNEWSTGLLLHGEDTFANHDGNGDGFIDRPDLRQFAILNRWARFSDRHIFQAAVKLLDERRRSGQDEAHAAHTAADLYHANIDTRRYEAFAKNAIILDPESNANIALILSGSLHDQRSAYGLRLYDVVQRNFYASLMFERTYGNYHSISTGLSFNYDHFNQHYRLTPDTALATTRLKEIENVPGAYAQYTFDLHKQLILMAGIRYDYSSLYGSMLTPRIHAKYHPTEQFTLHASAGRGYRNPHRLADYSYLLASSRQIIIEPTTHQESAWNIGGGATADLRLFDRDLSLSAEYYFTRFSHQAVVDLDSDPHTAALIYNDGSSRSHTFQSELSYHPHADVSVSVAYRFTDVRENYGKGLILRPLSSRSKGLISVSYTPMMGIWQLDATLAINGGGRYPSAYHLTDGTASWPTTYSACPQLNLQLTRNFRHWAIYIGGENLTNYRQPSPIISADNPWGPNFDATMVYGPITGAMAYVGFRYTFTKY